MTQPCVTVIIPHWNGEDFLRRCLVSLEKTTYSAMDVLVVDNHSTDNSAAMVKEEFPDVRIFQNPVNMGYAGGCNTGVIQSNAPFVVFLNNDTEVAPDWLDGPMSMMQADETIGAVQPKLRSLIDKKKFDYCGGAGGELDIYGFPAVYGRVFDHIEWDEGQYNRPRPVFWATGAACLIRRSVLEITGLLDVSFFAHMEEIDLFWRFHLAGYQVLYCPDAVVYHHNGGTLAPASLRKMVLNHRNSQIMLLKNYSCPSLLRLFPRRVLLEWTAAFAFLAQGNVKRFLAVFRGGAGVWRLLPVWLRERRNVQAMRRVTDQEIAGKMISESIALGYYLRGKRKLTDFIAD